MVARLVATLGRPFPLDPTLRAFLSPQAISGAGEDFLTREVRLGYRAPYMAELACRGGKYGELEQRYPSCGGPISCHEDRCHLCGALLCTGT